MRHRYFGKKLSRTTNERRRLLMVLARELLTHGRIKTTFAKAKVVQALVERLVTKAKKGTRASVRQVEKVLSDATRVKILLGWAKTRFGNRISGYTRIVKLGQRTGDSSEEVILSFVDDVPAVPEPKGNETEKKVVPKVRPKKRVKKKKSAK